MADSAKGEWHTILNLNILNALPLMKANFLTTNKHFALKMVTDSLD